MNKKCYCPYLYSLKEKDANHYKYIGNRDKQEKMEHKATYNLM